MPARLPCSRPASQFLKYGAPGNTGTLKSVGGRLLRVVSKGDDRYEIKEINKDTGEVQSILATVTNKYRNYFPAPMPSTVLKRPARIRSTSFAIP